MVKWWKPLAVCLLTLVLAVSLKKDFLFFLLGFEIMVIIASYVQLKATVKNVTMNVELPNRIVSRGESFDIHVRLKNNGILPVPAMLVRIAIRFVPEREELLLKGRLMLSGKEEGVLHFKIDGEHYGCLEVRGDRLLITDFLGIFQRKCQVDRKERQMMFVLPISANGDIDLPESEGVFANDEGDKALKGGQAVDASDIREYRYGDPRKLIHWKLSARLDELLVREMTDPAEKLMWLYLNLEERGEDRVRENPEAWDRFMELVAAASERLLQIDKKHVVIWIDSKTKQISRYSVVDIESLQSMLCDLVRAETFMAKDHSRLLKEIDSDETKGTCIEINLQGDISCTDRA